MNHLNCKCPSITQVYECKYLGIIIDSNFNFKKHICCLTDKLRILLRKFNQLKYFVPRSILYCLYFALVDSLISYGIVIYGSSFKTYINKIKQLQLRFLKLLVDKHIKNKFRDNYEGLFKHCKILPVDKKYLFEIAKEEYWSTTYKTQFIGKIKTRQASKAKFFVPKVNNNYGKRTKQYIVPIIFNRMSDVTKSVIPYKFVKMKKLLKNHFLEQL